MTNPFLFLRYTLSSCLVGPRKIPATPSTMTPTEFSFSRSSITGLSAGWHPSQANTCLYRGTRSRTVATRACMGPGTPVAASPQRGKDRKLPIGKHVCGKWPKTYCSPGLVYGTPGTTPQ